jgi:dienelactone hydrolase
VKGALFAAVLVAAPLLCAAAPPDDAPKGEDVRFTTADGLSIAATWYPPLEGTPSPAPVVIALPMYRHTRGSYGPMVRPVTDRGMALLVLDLRGHGDSAKQGGEDLGKRVEARDAALFNAMHADVEAAIAWLGKEKKTPPGRLALLGASVGCSVAIDTAVRNPDGVAAVACLTPGKDYLGVPTMEHVEKWPRGKPLLLVSSEAEADRGAGPIAARLDGRGAELRTVVDPGAAAAKEPVSLHGTDMFGRVPDVEDNLADWLALRIAFRRVDLGQDVTAVVGSTGTSLYVGVEAPAGSKTPLDSLTVRVGLGPVTDPWSKSATIAAGKRLGGPTEDAAARRRTQITRDRLGAESGRPFAVQVSLDGKKFLPEDGQPPLFFTLR